MAIAALTTWLIAGSAGLYMFRTWLSRGGLRDQRSRAGGLPPAVIFTHLSLGALGARLSNDALARTLSSEVLTGRLINNMLAGLPADQPQPERGYRRHLAPLVPAAHGVAAFVTFVLAVVSAISAR